MLEVEQKVGREELEEVDVMPVAFCSWNVVAGEDKSHLCIAELQGLLAYHGNEEVRRDDFGF